MKIVLMRNPAQGEDPYQNALKVLGDVTSLPVLAFQFVNLTLILEKIFSPSSFCGIILTSKRAVDAIKAACDQQKAKIPEEWKSLPCYVVGDATAKAAKDVGFACVGEESGNAENLAHFIAQDKRSVTNLKLLFVCGQQRRETLPQVLDENHVGYESLVVYESCEDSTLKENIHSYITTSGPPSYIVYFSPLGFKYSSDVWTRELSEKGSTVKVVAIGETTASALRARHASVITALKPTPQALLHAIEQDGAN